MSKEKPGVKLTEKEFVLLDGRANCCELKELKLKKIQLELIMLRDSHNICIMHLITKYALDPTKNYILDGYRLIEDEQEKTTKIPVD